jgi:cytochrome c-type biogenesis protein CcmH/NrfG
MALAEDIETPPAVEETVEMVPPAWLKELEEEPEALESAEVGQEQISAVQEWVAETITSEAPAEEAPSIRIPTPAGIATDESSELYNAQAALNAQAVEKALYHYNNLINQGEALDEIIHDLREALYHYPLEISLWQTLGDAYLRSNQLQEALEAYTKAEELLR